MLAKASDRGFGVNPRLSLELQDPPLLLVVSGSSFSDHGPVWLKHQRPSGGRCGGGGAIGGEIALLPLTHVFFNTVRFDGHKTSNLLYAWRRGRLPRRH